MDERRASDVPTYVEYGGADLGVTGLDTLIEHGGQGLYQPLDLRIAKCRISVAVRSDFDYGSAVRQGSRLRVAISSSMIAISSMREPHCGHCKTGECMPLTGGCMPLTGGWMPLTGLCLNRPRVRARDLDQSDSSQSFPIERISAGPVTM